MIHHPHPILEILHSYLELILLLPVAFSLSTYNDSLILFIFIVLIVIVRYYSGCTNAQIIVADL